MSTGKEPPVPNGAYNNFLPYLLARAGRLVSARFYRDLHLSGTSMTRWRLLATLYDGRPRTVGEIAEEILLEQSSTTRLIERAARAGLVAKRIDSRDRRRSLVAITPAGKSFIRDITRRAAIVDAGIVAELPSDMRKRMKTDLRRVIAILSEATRNDRARMRDG